MTSRAAHDQVRNASACGGAKKAECTITSLRESTRHMSGHVDLIMIRLLEPSDFGRAAQFIPNRLAHNRPLHLPFFVLCQVAVSREDLPADDSDKEESGASLSQKKSKPTMTIPPELAPGGAAAARRGHAQTTIRSNCPCVQMQCLDVPAYVPGCLFKRASK